MRGRQYTVLEQPTQVYSMCGKHSNYSIILMESFLFTEYQDAKYLPEAKYIIEIYFTAQKIIYCSLIYFPK